MSSYIRMEGLSINSSLHEVISTSITYTLFHLKTSLFVCISLCLPNFSLSLSQALSYRLALTI